jgi:hypothetical protein
VTTRDSDNASPGGVEQLKDNSLRAAGYAYLVGDAALFASGMMGGRSKEAASGLLYAAGGLACARYGNPDADARLKLLTHDLGEYLQKQGVHVPAGSMLSPGALAFGGAQLMHSGMQHGKGWDAASGALVAAGGLAGLLIPEKKPDPAHPAPNVLGKAWEWAQEKPLRAAGYLYSANNFTLIASALKERRLQPQQKSYLFKLLTAASYMLANGLLAASSKDEGSDHDKKDKTHALGILEQEAAKVIAAQHPRLQEALIQQVAGHLSGQASVGASAQEIAQDMRSALAQIGKPLPGMTWRQAVQPPAQPSGTQPMHTL